MRCDGFSVEKGNLDQGRGCGIRISMMRELHMQDLRPQSLQDHTHDTGGTLMWSLQVVLEQLYDQSATQMQSMGVDK